MGAWYTANIVYRDAAGWHRPRDEEDAGRSAEESYVFSCFDNELLYWLISACEEAIPDLWTAERWPHDWPERAQEDTCWLALDDLRAIDWGARRIGCSEWERWTVVVRQDREDGLGVHLSWIARQRGEWTGWFCSPGAPDFADPPEAVLALARGESMRIGPIVYARRQPTMKDVLDGSPWFKRFLAKACELDERSDIDQVGITLWMWV